MLVYLVQEGRGIGLGNKVRAYQLQDDGHDTVEANLALGFERRPSQLRSRRRDPARARRHVSVRLMTNNPKKRAGLEQAGVEVDALEAHWVGASEHNADYLEAKQPQAGTPSMTHHGEARSKKRSRRSRTRCSSTTS